MEDQSTVFRTGAQSESLVELQSAARDLAGLAGAPGGAEAMFRQALASEPASCPRCGTERLYALNGARSRCAACRLTFRMLTGRWAGRLRISPRQWAVLARCFDFGMDGVSAGTMAGVSEPTAYRAYDVIRQSAASELVTGPGAIRDACALRVSCRDGVYRVEKADVVGIFREHPRSPLIVYERWFAIASGPAPFEATVLPCPPPRSWARSENPGAWMRSPFISSFVAVLGRRGSEAAPELPLFAAECALRLNLRAVPPQERLASLLKLLARYAPRAEGVMGCP